VRIFWYREPFLFFSFFSDFIDFIYRLKVPGSVSGVCPYRLSPFFLVLRSFLGPITTLAREDFLPSPGNFSRPTFRQFSTHETIPPVDLVHITVTRTCAGSIGGRGGGGEVLQNSAHNTRRRGYGGDLGSIAICRMGSSNTWQNPNSGQTPSGGQNPKNGPNLNQNLSVGPDPNRNPNAGSNPN